MARRRDDERRVGHDQVEPLALDRIEQAAFPDGDVGDVVQLHGQGGACAGPRVEVGRDHTSGCGRMRRGPARRSRCRGRRRWSMSRRIVAPARACVDALIPRTWSSGNAVRCAPGEVVADQPVRGATDGADRDPTGHVSSSSVSTPPATHCSRGSACQRRRAPAATGTGIPTDEQTGAGCRVRSPPASTGAAARVLPGRGGRTRGRRAVPSTQSRPNPASSRHCHRTPNIVRPVEETHAAGSVSRGYGIGTAEAGQQRFLSSHVGRHGDGIGAHAGPVDVVAERISGRFDHCSSRRR